MASKNKTVFNLSLDDKWKWMATDLQFAKVWQTLKRYARGENVLLRDLSRRRVKTSLFGIAHPPIDLTLQEMGLPVFSKIDCDIYGTYWIAPASQIDHSLMIEIEMDFRLIDCATPLSKDQLMQLTSIHFADDRFEEELNKGLADACGGEFAVCSLGDFYHLHFINPLISREVLREQIDAFLQVVSRTNNYRISPAQVEILIEESLRDDIAYSIGPEDIQISERGLMLETRYRKELLIPKTDNLNA